MKSQRWCKDCHDYVPSRTFKDHMNQYNIGRNSDAVDRKQYTGNLEKSSEDYMICVLHQKKITDGNCPIKSCNFMPFGMIKKSYMMSCMKGIVAGVDHRVAPFFPHTDMNTGKHEMILIDMDTKTVTIMGVPIFIRC